MKKKVLKRGRKFEGNEMYVQKKFRNLSLITFFFLNKIRNIFFLIKKYEQHFFFMKKIIFDDVNYERHHS